MRSQIIALAAVGGCMLVGSASALLGETIVPGTVIYDFDTNTNGCDPDDWNFFGSPTTDFGADPGAQDGHGAFHAGDWLIPGGPFMGQGVGIGPFSPGQPTCGTEGSGIADVGLDLSLGTAITLRVRLELPPGDFPPLTQGMPGIRLQFQLIDSNGAIAMPNDGDTVAVLPGAIPGRPWVDRRLEPGGIEAWETFTIPLAGLDFGFDDDAVAGVDGFNLADIKAIRLFWRPGPTTAGVNVIHFDEITLIDDPMLPWADLDLDGDVDLDDYGDVQACYHADLTPTHPETVLFDFEDGDQGWASFGLYSTDSGLTATGSSGQGRYHVADFDIATTGFGVIDISPIVDLSAYTGLALDARMVDVAGQAPFSGAREFDLALGIGEKEFITTLTATTSYQTFVVNFHDLTPQPTPADLADPSLEIRLIVRSAGHTGVVELDYDQVTGIATAPAPCQPLDADRDGDIDVDDLRNFEDCLQGPGVTTGFYPWCY